MSPGTTTDTYGQNPMNNRVLVDTSAFYALVSETDEFHQKATILYSNLIDQRAQLYTTSYVLVEWTTHIHRRLAFTVLDKFTNPIRDVVTIFWVDGLNHWSAWDLLKSHDGRDLSFVDCTLVLLAKSLNAKLFAFDQDFVTEGLEVL